MNKVIAIRVFLQGKKTYVVALILALVAIAQWAGIDVPGVSNDVDFFWLLLNALGLSFLRAGIANK